MPPTAEASATVRVALRVGEQVWRYDVPVPVQARDQTRLATTILKRLRDGLAPLADGEAAAVTSVGRCGG